MNQCGVSVGDDMAVRMRVAIAIAIDGEPVAVGVREDGCVLLLWLFRALRSGICLEEGREDRVGLLEIVVHNVDEQIRVHELGDEAARG